MKRRLELMPEVLPDPTPHYDKGAPRNRTLAHLERLRSKGGGLKEIVARAERNDDGTIVLRASGTEFPENPPPFGYGIAFAKIERFGPELVLRFRALPEVPAVSLVIAGIPKKLSVKIEMSDLAVTVQEIPA
jgi:hypothetical protein